MSWSTTGVPNVLDRLGFGYRQLRETKPDIIFVTASAFGARGPWAARPGRDILGQSIGGIVSVTGTAAEPHPAGAAVADHTAGIVEALAVLAALRYRDQTGEGQEVDISLYGTVIAMQAWEITHHALTGRKLTHAGRGHTLIGVGTWGVFPTADGHLSLAGVLPDRWEEFCGLLDAPALGQDSRFQTLQGLTEHADALHAALDEIFVRRPTQAWLDLLEPAEILVAPVHDYAEIVQSEQARVNGYIPGAGPSDARPATGRRGAGGDVRGADRAARSGPRAGPAHRRVAARVGLRLGPDHAAPRRRGDLARGARRAPQLCSAPSNSTSRISLPLFRQRSKSASSSRP